MQDNKMHNVKMGILTLCIAGNATAVYMYHTGWVGQI